MVYLKWGAVPKTFNTDPVTRALILKNFTISASVGDVNVGYEKKRKSRVTI